LKRIFFESDYHSLLINTNFLKRLPTMMKTWNHNKPSTFSKEELCHEYDSVSSKLPSSSTCQGVQNSLKPVQLFASSHRKIPPFDVPWCQNTNCTPFNTRLKKKEDITNDSMIPCCKKKNESILKSFVCQKPSQHFTQQCSIDPLLEHTNFQKVPSNILTLWEKPLILLRQFHSKEEHHGKSNGTSSSSDVSPVPSLDCSPSSAHHYRTPCQKPKKLYCCEETDVSPSTPYIGTPSTAITSTCSRRDEITPKHLCPSQLLTHNKNTLYNAFNASQNIPPLTASRLYHSQGPLCFNISPRDGGVHPHAILKEWGNIDDLVLSQNNSQRKVHRGLWIASEYSHVAFPVAIKFVQDNNPRDGRSIKREIECHLFIYQKLKQLQKQEGYACLEDAWPCSELLGYHLNKQTPGKCTLITRKLSGPDFFDVIRQEHNKYTPCTLQYQYQKLYWCSLALKRIQQYTSLGIRHNDLKPDNIVLDFSTNSSGASLMDVKIIDLGTASMYNAKEFTGGTSWYESPEQKILEYYSKKQKDIQAAKKVNIGLESDIWAAGLSITEVLVGRRAVDAMKQPYGPGPLEYHGPSLGWNLDPQDWIQQTRRCLLHPRRDMSTCFLSFETAQFIFDLLVCVDPQKRGTLQQAINKLQEQTHKALKISRQSSDHISFKTTCQLRQPSPPETTA
jgi:serine/threonine protein kinase